MTGRERRLASHIEIGLFRVAQEALNNVVKHAQASTVRVRIEFAPVGVTLVIEDDGKGFDTANDDAPAGHFGLMGMRERLQLLQGKFTIKSTPGKGTRVMITAPLEEK